MLPILQSCFSCEVVLMQNIVMEQRFETYSVGKIGLLKETSNRFEKHYKLILYSYNGKLFSSQINELTFVLFVHNSPEPWILRNDCCDMFVLAYCSQHSKGWSQYKKYSGSLKPTANLKLLSLHSAHPANVMLSFPTKRVCSSTKNCCKGPYSRIHCIPLPAHYLLAGKNSSDSLEC